MTSAIPIALLLVGILIIFLPILIPISYVSIPYYNIIGVVCIFFAIIIYANSDLKV